jgi:amino acid permease
MIKLSTMSIKVTPMPHVIRQIIIRHTSSSAVKCTTSTTRTIRALTTVANYPSCFIKNHRYGEVS